MISGTGVRFKEIDTLRKELRDAGYKTVLEAPGCVFQNRGYERQFSIGRPTDSLSNPTLYISVLDLGRILINDSRREALYEEYNIAKTLAEKNPDIEKELNTIGKIVEKYRF